LKLFIGSLLVFSLIILFLFALFPSEILISRVVQINRAPMEVLKQIDDLREWKKWNVLVNGTLGGGNNRAPIITISDSTLIDLGTVQIRMIKVHMDTVFTLWSRGNESFAANFILTKSNTQTILAWNLKFHVKWYPWEKLASMFYDKNLGPQMEKSLLALKNELETDSQR
jgi:hypothetical protein